MTGERRLILVLDDDRAVRESLKFALEFEGLEIVPCACGHDLLAHPRLAEAACLVIDYQMPAMNGFDVIAALRARGCWLPTVLITSRPTGDLRRRAAVAGIRHVVEKPLLDGSLLESIWDVLGISGGISPLN